MQGARIRDHAVWEVGGLSWLLTMLSVGKERLPCRSRSPGKRTRSTRQLAQSTIVRVRQQANVGVVGDAMADEGFCRNVVKAIGESRSLPTGRARSGLRRPRPSATSPARSSPRSASAGCRRSHQYLGQLGSACSSSAIAAAPGVNPELEVGRFLTEGGVQELRAGRRRGRVRRGRKGPGDACLLQAYVPNQGDGWSYTLEYLRRYLETQRAPTAARRLPAADADARDAHRGAAPRARHLDARSGLRPEPLTAADVEWEGAVKAEAEHTLALVKSEELLSRKGELSR